MLSNFIHTAWRNIRRNKAFTFLNMLGLGAGMAVTLLIGLWVAHEYSYDQSLPGASQAYEVRQYNNDNTFRSGSLAMSAALRKDIPEISHVVETDWMDPHGLVVGDTKLYLNGGMVESSFLNVFQYPLMAGNAAQVLADPYSIVLTESTAKALFGGGDARSAVNKTVRFDNSHDLKVTGILRDLPANSNFAFKYLVPFSYYEATQWWVKADRSEGWGQNAFPIYVQLQPGVTLAQVAPKIRDLARKYEPKYGNKIMLHPLKDWHLITNFSNGKPAGGYIEYVRMFGIVGILVLLIACINFINLATARSVKRAREVGVRKTLGSGRWQLIFQFLTESILITGMAFGLALVIAQLSLPAFSRLTGNTLSIPYTSWIFWAIALLSVLITGLLAGSRPAFYLSSFQPVKVLKGRLQMGRAGILPRKVLVVIQLTCSIALIIGTITIYRQIGHARNRPVGYHLNRLMSSDLSSDLSQHYEPLKDELLRSGLVENVAISSSPATDVYWHGGVDDWPGKQPKEYVNMGTIVVSPEYFKTMGMEILEGRAFETPSDTANVLLNEASVRYMRLKDPVGKTIVWHNKERYRIIGIVKDALLISPYAAPDPTMFVYHPGMLTKNYLLYRLAPGIRVAEAVPGLTAIFNKYNPAYPYSYTFADDDYAVKFAFDSLVGKLSGLFAILAVLISCLGLFGLAASMAEQRTREIGIRKVLGASVSRLWLHLSGEFLMLSLVGSAIASPIAAYFLHDWLQRFTYRIDLGVGIFLFAALLAMLITVATISFQALRAAMTSPVRSLRTE